MNLYKKHLCDECSYYRQLQYKPELDAYLCEACYDLPTGKETKGMKLNEYQGMAARTIPTDDVKPKIERMKEFALSLCEEAGESASILKKVLYHGHSFDDVKREKLIGELGDLLWETAAVATEFNITLEEIAAYNIMKLNKRYPKGFSEERSVNRVD